MNQVIEISLKSGFCELKILQIIYITSQQQIIDDNVDKKKRDVNKTQKKSLQNNWDSAIKEGSNYKRFYF